jgi:hypothetical protein
MKQKYLILKNDEKNELTIQEFAELEKQDEYTLLCEETYSAKAIEFAISRGKEALISTLRTVNLYPPGLYAGKIAEAVMTLYNSASDQSIELFIDDRDFSSKDWKKSQDVVAIEDEPDEFDKTLEQEPEELDGLLEDNDTIKNLTEPIKLKSKRTNHLIMKKRVKWRGEELDTFCVGLRP